MKQTADIAIRRARPADLKALGELGAKLARLHHNWDPRRFFVVPRMHEGYAWWLGKELKNRDAVILVAERRGHIIGYTYGRIEQRDWNALRDTCGMAIDLIVDSKARKSGAGRLLVDALLAGLKEKGAPRVILTASTKNHEAQKFFESAGFRPTMVEMTCELGTKRTSKRA